MVILYEWGDSLKKRLGKLQKSDVDTNALIDKVQKFLFSIGIRTSRERAWFVFQQVFRLPYELLMERNEEIAYQGVGKHLTQKEHNDQILTIQNVGRFEIKAVSNKQGSKAVMKFKPSKEFDRYVAESIKVVNVNE